MRGRVVWARLTAHRTIRCTKSASLELLALSGLRPLKYVAAFHELGTAISRRGPLSLWFNHLASEEPPAFKTVEVTDLGQGDKDGEL